MRPVDSLTGEYAYALNFIESCSYLTLPKYFNRLRLYILYFTKQTAKISTKRKAAPILK